MQTSNDNTPMHSNASSFCCICIFSALYEPHVGGVETYTKGIANALVKKGHRVIVVTNNTDNALKQESANGIEVVRLPCSPLLNGRFPLSKKCPSSDALWKWLDSQAIDHVVVNTRFYPLSILGLQFARKKSIEPVLIEHGSAHLTLGNPALDIPLNIVEHTMTMLAKHSKPRCFAVSQKASEWLSHFGISSCGEITNAIEARFSSRIQYPQRCLAHRERRALRPRKGSYAACGGGLAPYRTPFIGAPEHRRRYGRRWPPAPQGRGACMPERYNPWHAQQKRSRCTA